ncbi:hypothetical protein BHE74_00012237 [Ensete ventricosum]|nr:hypothetical protein BHE74_00012237 [Ensete ventricosum]RZR84763.1 hypothetical protein BHM03_00011641 [Ensete ventricosum]
MGSIAADAVGGHDGTDDDCEGAEDEEGHREGDLLDGRTVPDGVAGVAHHDVLLIGDGEGVVDVRHRRPRDCVLPSLIDKGWEGEEKGKQQKWDSGDRTEPGAGHRFGLVRPSLLVGGVTNGCGDAATGGGLATARVVTGAVVTTD